MSRIFTAAIAAAWLCVGTAHAAESPRRIIGAQAQQIIDTAIDAKDFDRSIQFYSKIIGMKAVEGRGGSSPGGGGQPRYVTLSFSGTLEDTCLMIRQWDATAPEQTASPKGLRPAIAFKVTDIHAVLESARQAGFNIFKDAAPATKEPSLFFAILLDPDGRQVELLQHN